MINFPRFEPSDASLFEDAYVLQGEAGLNIAPSVAYLYLADTASWPQWYPRMKSARWISAEPHGLNSEREVTVMRQKMVQRVVEVDAPWRITFTALTGASFGVKSIVEQFEIVPMSEHACTLRWRMGLKYRFLHGFFSGIGSFVMRVHPMAGAVQRQVPKAFARFVWASAVPPAG